MQYSKRQRGSALLMVVGLLTIIGMLGATFLFISRSSRKQANALTIAATVDPMAAGFVSEVSAAMKADLYLGSSLPYAKIATEKVYDKDTKSYRDPTTDEVWARFADVPSEEIDPWLSTTVAATADSYYTNLRDLDPETATKVDADGSGDDEDDKDALLFDTGQVDRLGRHYYGSIRVVDLSALINVNVATDLDVTAAGALPAYNCPTRMDLDGFIGSTLYNNVNTARSGASGTTPLNILTNLALCPMTPPSANYKAFGIADEIYARWQDSDNNATNQGRLFDATSTSDTPLAAAIRGCLTTASTSRNFLRNGTATDALRTLLSNEDGAGGTGLTCTLAKRHALFEAMKQFFSDMGLSVNERLVAEFVANTWAYESSGESNRPWPYRPESNPDWVAFGMRQDLVITEVYAANKPESEEDAQDQCYGSAIEIFNPTNGSISLSNYKVTVGGDSGGTFAFGSDTVAAGKRVVVFYYNEGDKAADDAETTIGFPGLDPVPTGWYDGGAAVSLVKGSDYSIILTRRSNGVDVPIDRVRVGTGADDGFDYSCTDKLAGEEKSVDIRRDDSLSRCKYNIGVYKSFTAFANKLGEANGLSATDLDTAGAKYPVPILTKGSAIQSFAELRNIYVGGNMIDGTKNLTFSHYGKTADYIAVFPDGPARGRLDFCPASSAYTTAPAMVVANANATYPDVPITNLIQERLAMIPPDTTREENNKTRVYGRVNLNTAPLAVLERLPWPSALPASSDFTNATWTSLPTEAAQAIIDYRNSTSRSAAGVTGLRSNSAVKGFLTPGEAAVPLATLVTSKLQAANGNDLDKLQKSPDFIYIRDYLYECIANCVTTQSDTYAVFIRINLGDAPEADPKYWWHYLAVIDRSNCLTETDEPAVILFTRIRR